MARTKGAHTLKRQAPTTRQRIWQAMRILRVFSYADLQATAEAGRDNVRKFCQALHRAGYLRLERPKRNGKKGGYQVFRLVRDTGPNAPIPRDVGVYDLNQEKVYGLDD